MSIEILFLGLIELEALMINNLKVDTIPSPNTIELQLERERFDSKMIEMERVYILPYNK